MKIKASIYQWVARKEAGKHPRNVKWPRWKDLRNMLFLYSNIDEQEVLELRRALMNEDKHVSTLSLSNKDETIFGTLKKEVKTAILAPQYDILVDLTHEDTWALRYAALFTRANFKAGRTTADEDMPEVFDFVMDMPDAKPKDVMTQIKKYILQIQSND